MEIPKTFKDEIWDYCRANNITNIDEFTLKCLKQGFTALKFGSTPTPVKEVIVEVEKIVEVPVEKIVEVPVEKEVYITDNSEMQKLTEEIERLQKALTKTMNDRNGDIFALEQQIIEKTKEVKTLTEQLQEEKNKKKRDIYGE